MTAGIEVPAIGLNDGREVVYSLAGDYFSNWITIGAASVSEEWVLKADVWLPLAMIALHSVGI